MLEPQVLSVPRPFAGCGFEDLSGVPVSGETEDTQNQVPF